MYCGIITTWNGSIMDNSMQANQNPLNLKLILAKPYPITAEEATAPMVDKPAITKEFLKKVPKLYQANPCQPTL